MLSEPQQRNLVIEEAATWLGTKFHYNAAIKGVGVACGPFLIECYKPYAKDANLVFPVAPTFPKDWASNTQEERFRNFVSLFCQQVTTPKQGDVALFRLGNSTRPFNHGALVLNWPEAIHSYHRGGVELVNATLDSLLRKAEVTFWSPWGFVYSKQS